MADSDSTTGKSPAFQFYPNDFTTGTLTLSTEEVGAYILLMCHCWDKGHIPSDVGLMARIARLSNAKMRRAWIMLSPKFQARPEGGFVQPRLERERQKQTEYRKRQADASRKRWDTQASPKPVPVDMPQASSSVSSLQSSSSSSDFRQRAAAGELRIERDESEPSLTARAGAFCEWYADKHAELFAIGYMGTNRDYTTAIELCKRFSDQDLREAALVWFGQTDDFATKGTRSVPKFASRVSGCLATVRKVTA